MSDTSVHLPRYIRNGETVDPHEQLLLREKKIAVVGCGGLGGYVIEMLARLGVGHLTVIDGDVFDVSNLNRQLLCTEALLGHSKAHAAQKRIQAIDSQISVIAHHAFLTAENGQSYLAGHDLVIDALDSITSRFVLEALCLELNIILIHGAIAGWYGQIATIYPGDNLLKKIYKSNEQRGKEKILGNPSFTPALIASLQVSEATKVLLNKGETLRNQLLFMNCLDYEMDIINFHPSEITSF